MKRTICEYMMWNGKIDISNVKILNEIKLSAKRIIENGNGDVIPETCRLCKILRASEEFMEFYKTCEVEQNII